MGPAHFSNVTTQRGGRKASNPHGKPPRASALPPRPLRSSIATPLPPPTLPPRANKPPRAHVVQQCDWIQPILWSR
eukprot:scaffold1937_cov120-Isochrysis_galbana.AAC.7